MPQALKYDSGGKGHWVLQRLSERPHSRDELMSLGLAHYGFGGDKRVSHAAGALHGDQRIRERSGKYEITPAGEGALRVLSEGRDLYPRGQPSARVFSREAA